MSRLTALMTAGLVAGAAILGPGPAAHADVDGPEDLPAPSADQLERSVHRWSVDGAVRSFESREKEGDRTTITLATDILFSPNSWELPASSPGRIEELVADIPDGARVAVHGHTDSTPTGQDFDNQELSENRADAVAGVLRQVRPDLELDVAGLADTRPADTGAPDDPEVRAANRRVEIIYTG